MMQKSKELIIHIERGVSHLFANFSSSCEQIFKLFSIVQKFHSRNMEIESEIHSKN
jgi:hypothetical protein